MCPSRAISTIRLKNMKQGNPSKVIETLTRIWQRVLQRAPIGIDDNFFELGGDPWLAIELSREIEGMLGRCLLPLVLYQTPTIASLANFLEAPASPPFPK